MAYLGAQHLRPDEVPEDMRKQMVAVQKSISSKNWNRKVIGGAMKVNVIINFLTGTDPKGKKWKSNAPRTKAGGKFSKGYYTRPSGAGVSSSSLRLYDTSELANSYGVLWASDRDVEVGPIGGEPLGKTGKKRNRLLAEVAEIRWNNHIVGWGKRGKRIVDSIVSGALDDIMRGRTPPIIGYTVAKGLRAI